LDLQAAGREDDAAKHKQGRASRAPGEALRLQPLPQGVPGVSHGRRNHPQAVTTGRESTYNNVWKKKKEEEIASTQYLEYCIVA